MGTQLIQIIQAIASLATVGAVILTWRQLRLVRKQATTTFEDRLTEQYRRIMEDIPTCIWLGSELKALREEQRDRCRDAIYRYTDLSNEEALLYSMKRVTDDAWIEWRKGIKSNMKLPAFIEVWAQVNEKSPASFEELKAHVGTKALAIGDGMPQAMKASAGAGYDPTSTRKHGAL